MSAILSLIILIFSVVLHEVAHGYTAKWQGDETASMLGRLSPNPLRHIDMFGSVVLPTLTYMLGGFVLGWAKPVPIEPRNFRNQRWGEGLVAIAGPATNILLAIILLVFGWAFGRFDGLLSSLSPKITSSWVIHDKLPSEPPQ